MCKVSTISFLEYKNLNFSIKSEKSFEFVMEGAYMTYSETLLTFSIFRD